MPAEQPFVHLCEVGPRDGLQNEKSIVPVEAKVRFVEMLAEAGLREIEVTSFVSPKWVPQLADAEEVLARIARRAGTVYSALVPNEKGLERALSCGVRKVSVFTAASEGFARRNINASVAESIERFRPVVAGAHAAGATVRGYVSCIVECPFDGSVRPAAVREVCARLSDIGVDELDLGETIGVAVPDEIARVLEACAAVRPMAELVLHLHDTRGTALACAARALAMGVRRFDASAGGIGGCPYAPGASGNVATEELDYLCTRSGYSTGVDRSRLCEAARFAGAALGRALPSRLLSAEAAGSSCQVARGDAASA
ncbi:MAG: hydroxymethylglutaryl-CoA lyase [Planctomycetaceae bacterium]|jgi:hydroxymethylglutaryl-CoA lyase|nr:hydroxymethylglutaryl-CoA lyase [Planctomycetaceae bacterium]